MVLYLVQRSLSSNKWVAPSTITSSFGPASRPQAIWLSSITTVSRLPTISRVGAITRDSAKTTAPISLGIKTAHRSGAL